MAQEYPAMSENGALALALAFVVIMSFGTLANALVVATLAKYRTKMLKEAKDVLIFSLAVGDLVMTSLVCPFGFSSAVARRWTTGNIGCTWYGFVTSWIGLSSMLQLAVISIERYYTLSRPNASPTPKKRAIQAIMASWLIALVACCLPFLGFSKYTREGSGLHCAISWETEDPKYATYCLFLLIVFFAIPVTAIAVSYAKMFLVIRKMTHEASLLWGSGAQATRESYMAQVRFTRQLVIVTAGFLFAWSPYAIMSMLRAFAKIRFDAGYSEIPSFFSKTSNIYNPIIYFFMYKRLRERAFVMLGDMYKKLTT